MTAGLSAVNLANKWLSVLNNTSFTAITTVFVQLHTSAGDPGASGTANVSSVTTRPSAALAAASGGSISASGTPTWSSWAGTNGEVVGYISVWDASTAGNFLFSAALAANKTVNTGDTLQLTTLTVALTPIAA